MALKTAKAGSIKALRASLERKGGGNDAFLQRVPADDSITVRFLTEPPEWQSYFEHYDQVMKYYPCSDDNCPGCVEGGRPTQRYLANALDVQGDRVIPLVIPKTLVTKLLHSYDRYDTLTDRDYELIRIGSGLDTDYDRQAEMPQRRPTKQHTLLDLAEVLENQLKRATGDTGSDDAPVVEEKAPARAASRPGTKPVPVDDDEDDFGKALPRAELDDMSLRELRAYAKDDLKIPAADIRGMDQDALIELIEARTKDDSEPEEETADDPDAEDEAPEDAEEEADDGDELTEDEVRAMTLQELRKLCGQLEIPWKRTDGKALLIKKVLETAQDDEDEVPF